MTKTLLASAAIIFALSTTAFASAPVEEVKNGFKSTTEYNDLEAKRRKPRVPGGSGCDDPEDIAEHPECTPTPAKKKRADVKSYDVEDVMQEAKRRKKRVPGGSGCDDPGDIAEHPECRA